MITQNAWLRATGNLDDRFLLLALQADESAKIRHAPRRFALRLLAAALALALLFVANAACVPPDTAAFSLLDDVSTLDFSAYVVTEEGDGFLRFSQPRTDRDLAYDYFAQVLPFYGDGLYITWLSSAEGSACFCGHKLSAPISEFQLAWHKPLRADATKVDYFDEETFAHYSLEKIVDGQGTRAVMQVWVDFRALLADKPLLPFPVDTTLEYWILDDGSDGNFTREQFVRKKVYTGTGYSPSGTDAPLLYRVASWPDTTDSPRLITDITVKTSAERVYGLSIDSAPEEVARVLSENGFVASPRYDGDLTWTDESSLFSITFTPGESIRIFARLATNRAGVSY